MGVEELRRIAKKGMMGAMVWAEPPEDRPDSLPDFDVFWPAAQELNLPLSLNILTRGLDFFKGNLVRQVAVLHHEIVAEGTVKCVYLRSARTYS